MNNPVLANWQNKWLYPVSFNQPIHGAVVKNIYPTLNLHEVLSLPRNQQQFYKPHQFFKLPVPLPRLWLGWEDDLWAQPSPPSPSRSPTGVSYEKCALMLVQGGKIGEATKNGK